MMSCEGFFVRVCVEHRAPFSDWQGISCLLSFLTWAFKKTTGRAEGCKKLHSSEAGRSVIARAAEQSRAAYLERLGVEL